MADPRKAVLLLGVFHPVAIHLPGEPFPAIDANVNQEGEPTLEPEVHEPKLPMQVVEIEVLTLAGLQLELQGSELAIAAQIIGAAWLHTSEDPNQAFLQAVLLDQFFGQGVLSGVAGVQVAKWAAGGLSNLESGRLDPFSQVEGKVFKVFEQDSFDLQIRFHRSGVIELRQAASETQTIESRENSDDIGLMLSYKGVWSVTGRGRVVFHTHVLPVW